MKKLTLTELQKKIKEKEKEEKTRENLYKCDYYWHLIEQKKDEINEKMDKIADKKDNIERTIQKKYVIANSYGHWDTEDIRPKVIEKINRHITIKHLTKDQIRTIVRNWIDEEMDGPAIQALDNEDTRLDKEDDKLTELQDRESDCLVKIQAELRALRSECSELDSRDSDDEPPKHEDEEQLDKRMQRNKLRREKLTTAREEERKKIYNKHLLKKIRDEI